VRSGDVIFLESEKAQGQRLRHSLQTFPDGPNQGQFEAWFGN
jgi:hypothetical protein